MKEVPYEKAKTLLEWINEVESEEEAITLIAALNVTIATLMWTSFPVSLKFPEETIKNNLGAFEKGLRRVYAKIVEDNEELIEELKEGR